MANRVVITGAGVLSALGDTPETLYAGLCAGQNGVGTLSHPDLPTDGYAGVEISGFSPQTYLGDKNFRPLDRTSHLAASAVHLALSDSGWTEDKLREQIVGLVLGTMFCSVRTIAEFDRRAITLGPSYAKPLDFANTVINAASGQTAIWHHLRGINSTISTGLSSGLQAIAYATDLIHAGRADRLVAGGVEELCFESVYGFGRAGLLAGDGKPSENAVAIPFDARRNGFVPGEAAAFLMLETLDAARARGSKILAEIKGYGTAYDPTWGRTAKTAAVIEQAMTGALRDARRTPSDIRCLSASANGSVNMDAFEAEAIARLFAQAGDLPVTSIKTALGESMGASGALQIVAMTQTMQNGTLPGIHGLTHIPENFPLTASCAENRHGDFPIALINAINYDGHCCSLVLEK
ncbi:MAG: beta-ketoacyl-[acyl-carrier-protein] synthase family protein [candidate division Zixibacteria bacterium]|nr:beta-ketoacyl-[acyl-carrier-protein] synthase family protein [candidate division Zixibacteria bacterium]